MHTLYFKLACINWMDGFQTCSNLLLASQELLSNCVHISVTFEICSKILIQEFLEFDYLIILRH